MAVMADLTSFPTLVESPFIVVKAGDFILGKYSSTEHTFPNYMDSMDIVKVNGAVNTYTIKLIYGITRGDDPNLLEKVFSSISKTRKISISYGDLISVYKEEEAIITKITSAIDTSGSKISYTINCTSTALALQATTFNFPAYNSAKPSDVMKETVENKAYGVTDVFTGMADSNFVSGRGLIPGNDKPVPLQAQQKMSVLNYLNYLTNSMSNISNTANSVLNNSQYNMTIVDTVQGDASGPYFKITEVPATVSSETLNALNCFELNVGYADPNHPTDNLITSFNVNNDQAWSILYDYSGELNPSQYIYRINGKGQLVADMSPNLTTSKKYQETIETNKNWWSKVTQFPISATVTIKGLIRPAVLMSYVRVNVWFYGAQHDSSGLYFITKQQDTLDSSGYRTTLTLTRIPEVDLL